MLGKNSHKFFKSAGKKGVCPFNENNSNRIPQFNTKNERIAVIPGNSMFGSFKLPITPPAFSYITPAIKAESAILPALNAVLIGGLLKICVIVFSSVLVGMIIKGILMITIAAEKTGP
nr:hypothetical protein [uncultured Caproiciproducens sp.]